MPLKVIEKRDVEPLIRHLMERFQVVGIKKKDGKNTYGVIESPAELRLDSCATITSPKKYFFPQRETLLQFAVDGSWEPQAVVEAQPRIIFGMRPCDIAATWMLDMAFSEVNADANYLEKRRRALIIGVDCKEPCDEYCFCKSMGTLEVETGYDLFFTAADDTYIVRTGTPEGEALLGEWGKAREALYEDRVKLRAVQREKDERFKEALEFDVEELPRFLEDSYRSLLWDVLGEKCLSCGSCNLVCPTCYCFNVLDEVKLNLSEGERYRVWDSCQLEGFAKVATGENFRERRGDRVRHRFFRKGKYMKEMFGRFGCVGCGRCTRACLVHINPIEVYNQLKGGE